MSAPQSSSCSTVTFRRTYLWITLNHEIDVRSFRLWPGGQETADQS
jgi:hypothetical protein